MKRSVAYLLIAFVMVWACTSVKFGEYVPQHVKETAAVLKAGLKVDWSRVSVEEGEDLPAAFSLAMARTTKARHSFFTQVDTLGSAEPDTLRFIYGEEGEYESLLFASAGEFLYENIDTFKQDNAVSLRSLYAVVPEQKKSMGKYDDILTDAYVPLVDASKIYRAELRQTFTTQKDTTQVQLMVFRPEQLVQRITLRTLITHDPDFNINRVFANITGIPRRIELLSGLLDVNDDHLGQILFELKEDEAFPDWWEGTVDILGIVPPPDTVATSHAGILYLSADNEEQTQNVYFDPINLKRVLERWPLLETTDIQDWYRGGERTLTLEVDKSLYIDGNGTVTISDRPVNDWKDPGDDGEIDPIDDGGNTVEG